VSGWTVTWLAWIAFGVVAELVALVRTQRGDTLSEQVWAYLKVTPGRTPLSAALVRFPTYVLAVFLLWLVPHFTLGWWA
jgi:hypothetical protein